jgi:hypothetical protein
MSFPCQSQALAFSSDAFLTGVASLFVEGRLNLNLQCFIKQLNKSNNIKIWMSILLYYSFFFSFRWLSLIPRCVSEHQIRTFRLHRVGLPMLRLFRRTDYFVLPAYFQGNINLQPAQFSQYSDYTKVLAMEESGFNSRQKQKTFPFPQYPSSLWGPSNLQSSGDQTRGTFPEMAGVWSLLLISV